MGLKGKSFSVSKKKITAPLLEDADRLLTLKATELMIQKIISGGQTGADLAALDMALKFNIPPW